MSYLQNLVYAVRNGRFKSQYKFIRVTEKRKSRYYVVTKAPYGKLRLPKFIWDRL